MGEHIYNNILIFNLRKIGDTIMATASAYLLKKAYPQAKITILVRPLTKTIVENNPVIDEVMIYDYSHKAKWQDMKHLSQEIRQRNFDLAITIDNKPRSAIIAYLAKIPNRIGYERITMRNWYLKMFYTEIITAPKNFHSCQQVKNHEIFINKITGKNDKAKMIMPRVSEQSRLKVDNLLNSLAKNKKNIALCIRSGVKFKDWSSHNFLEVVRYLKANNDCNFYIVGANSDYEYSEKFIAESKIDIKNFCGKTNLPELGYLLKQSDLLLSVDTGTAHIAASQDTNTVVVFAGTSHYHWAPYGDTVKIVSVNINCYPCNDKVRKECNSYPCLNAIDIEQVKKDCIQMIE